MGVRFVANERTARGAYAMKHTISQGVLDSDLLREVTERSAQNVADCYQCGKCTAGCPMARFMDVPPNQVTRLLQVGDATVLEKRAIWLCVSCETCVTRCPREIDLPRVMDALRQIAYEQANEQPVAVGKLLRNALQETLAGIKEGLQMGTPHAQRVFSATFLENIRRFGRSFETGLIGSFNLNTASLLGNMDKGPEMLMKGKMRLLPDNECKVAAIQEIFAKIEELEGKKI